MITADRVLEQRIAEYHPQTPAGATLRSILGAPNLHPELKAQLLDVIERIHVVQSRLEAVVFRGLDGTPWIHADDPRRESAIALEWRHRSRRTGLSYHPFLDPRDPLAQRLVERYGVVSEKVVTNVFVNALVAQLAAGTSASTFKYHGLGTGTTAEAATDTTLVTELTTEYGNSNTRATGSQTDVSGTPHTYQTVGTNTLDSGTPAVTEHGVFSASTSGTLMDRSKFAAINLDGTNGDGLQTTYTLQISAGG